jgi:hypothetical protein
MEGPGFNPQHWEEKKARCYCLRPAIPATQEAEIRRITVRRQPWENSSREPILKNIVGELG